VSVFVGGSGDGDCAGVGDCAGEGAGVCPGKGAGVGDGTGEGVGARFGATTSSTTTVMLSVSITVVKFVLLFKAVTKLAEKLPFCSLSCLAAASISACGASIVVVATTEPADKTVSLMYSRFTPVVTKVSSIVVLRAFTASSEA